MSTTANRERWMVSEEVAAVLPGIAAAVAIALIARAVSHALPQVVGEVLVAVLLGLCVSNLVTLPPATAAGIRFSLHRVLRVGIILLGARLSLGAVATIGVQALMLVAICMALALAFAAMVGRALGLPPRLTVLIAVGTAVCGNSAIVATAPVIDAEEREVGVAVATITLFGTLAVFLYPLMGRALALPDAIFGFWTGTAVNDTSQVVAASAAYSGAARDVAAVVKLVRNTLMAPLILAIAWWWSRHSAPVAGDAARKGAFKAFPLFVLGFIAMALARTVGVIDQPTAAWIDEGARFCILVALSGVGLSTQLARLRPVGPAPFYLGFGTAAFIACVSLALIFALDLGPTAAPR